MAYPPNIFDGLNILLIDDEEDSLEILEIILGTHGANIRIAPNGDIGLRMVNQHHPDLIITDLSMPMVDGWEFLQIMQQEYTKNIPIVALTAHAMRGDREATLDAGFDGYISKPISADNFITEITRILVGIPGIATKLK